MDEVDVHFVADPASGEPGDPAPIASVLVVEDDDLMRDLMRELLELEGHQVLAADHPEAALELLQQTSEPIDVLITDVVMPGMSGFELVRKLAAQGARPKVIFMSGYTDQILADQGELSPDDAFLRKPFGTDALTQKVRDVLNSRDSD